MPWPATRASRAALSLHLATFLGLAVAGLGLLMAGLNRASFGRAIDAGDRGGAAAQVVFLSKVGLMSNPLFAPDHRGPVARDPRPRPVLPTMRVVQRLLVIVVLAGSASCSVALAHGDEAHERGPKDWHELWRTWGLEPGVVVPLALTAWLYARGLARLWRQAGVGHGVTKWEAASFAGGMARAGRRPRLAAAPVGERPLLGAHDAARDPHARRRPAPGAGQAGRRDAEGPARRLGTTRRPCSERRMDPAGLGRRDQSVRRLADPRGRPLGLAHPGALPGDARQRTGSTRCNT